MKVKKIPKPVFDYIEKFVPFSSIDMIVRFQKQGIILTKRSIRPYKGWWHLPGSVVLKNEPMVDTVARSAKEELDILVEKPAFLGNYELFTKRRHYITHLYLADYKSGKIRLDSQSSEYTITKPRKLPIKTIPIQRKMIQDALKLRLV